MKKNQFLKVVTYFIYCNIVGTCRVNDNRFFSVTIVILTEICVQTGGLGENYTKQNLFIALTFLFKINHL